MYLHRNISGKYRVSSIGGDTKGFDFLKKEINHNLHNGVYIYFGKPKIVPLVHSNPELNDFFIANGYFKNTSFELLSYITGDKKEESSSLYLSPPGHLPESETQGYSALDLKENCWSNVPDPAKDYIKRKDLEESLHTLLIDDRHPIITLHGVGGIGKTSLALQVIQVIKQCNEPYYDGIIWFSARDIDLLPDNAKQVRPNVLSQEDVTEYYTKLISKDKASDKKFDCKKFFERSLCQSKEFERCLFVFDNFETVQNPLVMFTWLDTFIRLPNKILITTRLRDFKADYPLEVRGMTEQESENLIRQTALSLKNRSITKT